MKYCSDCIHYRHGQTENSCARGGRFYGYLHPPCYHFAEGKEGDEDAPVKVCIKCGRKLPADAFYFNRWNKDRLSDVCKECKPFKYRK
mgnify:CR=1 FL=1